MKIIIFGASGAGTTTLGKSLSSTLGWSFLDADAYYWEKTNPPFQTKIPLEKRNERLKTDFHKQEHVIISGSLCTWSAYWNTAFDLGVFLHVPPSIRMERLRNRELERYGETILADKASKERSDAFLAWAAKYDDETFSGRSIRQHRAWIDTLDCEVIEIYGAGSNTERQAIILKKIEPSFKQNL